MIYLKALNEIETLPSNYRSLWVAVLNTSVEDLLNFKIKKDRNQRTKQARLKKDALIWIAEDKGHELNSFNGICFLLGISANKLRAAVLKKYREYKVKEGA